MNLLYVGLGGFFGAILRYALQRGVASWLPQASFPWATLATNLTGCFLIGWLASWFLARGEIASPAALFVLVGLLGGFTTYSTFSLELVQLARQGSFGVALASAGLHLLLGLGAVLAGIALVK